MDEFGAAFPALYRRAYSVAFVILGDRAEAEDVAAEVTARALVRWPTIASYPQPWVIRVAGNLAIDRTRRRARQAETRADDTAPGPTADRVDLQRALRQLPRRQREVVVLRFIADLPESDVASVLGCSTGTVKSHAARGMAALRTAFGQLA